MNKQTNKPKLKTEVDDGMKMKEWIDERRKESKSKQCYIKKQTNKKNTKKIKKEKK